MLEDGADNFGSVLRLYAFREEVSLDLCLDGVDGSVTISLLGDLVAFAQLGFEMLQHFRFEFGIVFRLEVAGFLGSHFSELDDRVDDRLETLVAEHDGAEHDVFVQFLGFRFNHQDGVLGAGDDEVKNRFFHLVEMRVQDIFAVDVADACAADRAHEGNAGQGKRCRGCNHGQDVRVVLEVMLDDGNDDLGVVLVAFREERTDRAVDQARNQRFVFRRTTFALEVATRDLAGGIGLFLVVDGQREEVLARLRRLGRNDGGENDGFAVGGENRAVSLAGDLARFQLQRTAGPFDFDGVGIEHILSFNAGNGVSPRLFSKLRGGNTFHRSHCDTSRARQREAFQIDRSRFAAPAKSIRQSCPMTGLVLVAKPAHPGPPQSDTRKVPK
ncbi:hypothetical protein D3C73_445700 [compost metagenome]